MSPAPGTANAVLSNPERSLKRSAVAVSRGEGLPGYDRRMADADRRRWSARAGGGAAGTSVSEQGAQRRLGTPVLGAPVYEHLRFPGCREIPLLRDRLEDYEGRIEYWEARTETAWVVAEPVGGIHEGTSRRLPHLVERIVMVRGAPIVSFVSVDLLVRDAEGKPDRMMQADETVYLHPERAVTPEGSLVIGEHDLPDVVLEVDHTTDVRPGKLLLLLLYEAWGFPELWVVVPPAGATRRKPAGVTIHRMLGGRYESVAASVAFPGWTAAEIHAGLTEPVTAQTYDVLARVGRALGAREGTGPDDDPTLRALGEQTLARGLTEGRTRGLAEGRTRGLAEGRTRGLAEGHSRGLAEGRAKGLAEGRAQELAAVVRNILEARGMSFTDEVSDAVVDVPRDAVVAAAMTCTEAEDFRRRLGSRRG